MGGCELLTKSDRFGNSVLHECAYRGNLPLLKVTQCHWCEIFMLRNIWRVSLVTVEHKGRQAQTSLFVLVKSTLKKTLKTRT